MFSFYSNNYLWKKGTTTIPLHFKMPFDKNTDVLSLLSLTLEGSGLCLKLTESQKAFLFLKSAQNHSLASI